MGELGAELPAVRTKSETESGQMRSRLWRNLARAARVEAARAPYFPLLIALLLALLQLLPGPHAFDDAYITYRYARNLAERGEFVYNPGERVLGTTTPLYTVVLALLGLAAPSHDLPWISIALNAAFDLGTALLLVRLLLWLGMTPTAARFATVAYLLSPLRLRVALGGMETSVAVFWLLLASYLYVVKRDRMWAAACSGVACLARPDLVVLPVLLLAYEVFESRRFPWRPAAAFLAVLLPWLGFAWLYFGNPLPQSIIAKTSAYILHPHQASIDLLAYVGTRSRSTLRSWPAPAVGAAAVAMLWLFAVGGWRAIRKEPRALPLALFPVFYALALSLANPLLASWYFPPLLLWLEVFVGFGIFTLLASAELRLQTVTIGIALAGLLALEWQGEAGPRGWADSLRGREVLYQHVAGSVAPTLEPGSSIGLPEIGVLGYALGGHRVVDTVGLVTPEAVPHLLAQPAPGQTFTYAISDEVIAALEPDYLITLEIFVRPTLMQSEEFLASYRLVERFETDALDSDGLFVFRRIEPAGGTTP